MPIPGIYPLAGFMAGRLISPSATTFNIVNNATLSGGNLIATTSTIGVASAYSSVFKLLPNAGGPIGKYFFSFTINTKGGNLSAVGMVGIFGTGGTPTDADNIALDGGFGVVLANGNIIDSSGGWGGQTLGPVNNGDVIDFAINYRSGGGTGYARKNGGHWNGDASFDPTGAGNGFTITSNFSKYAPGVSFNDTVPSGTTLPAGLQVTLNCGASTFAYYPPPGYIPGWGAGGIPTPPIYTVTEHAPARDVVISGAGSFPATDADFDTTVLMLSGEGANGSTTFTDLSSRARGNGTLISSGPSVSTAQFKYGSASILFNTSTPCLQFSPNDDFLFPSTTPFTIEMFIRPSTIGGSHYITSVWDNSSGNSWVLWLNGANLAWSTSEDGSSSNPDMLGTTTLATSTWYHVCVDFDGTKYRMYVNGTMEASSTTLRSLFNATSSTFTIGANSFGGAFNYAGNIDELRISKGIARYASDGGFTVPAAAYPRS